MITRCLKLRVSRVTKQLSIITEKTRNIYFTLLINWETPKHAKYFHSKAVG